MLKCISMVVTQDEITTEEEKNEGQDSFIEKKLALLSFGSKTLIYEKRDDSKMTDGRLQ